MPDNTWDSLKKKAKKIYKKVKYEGEVIVGQALDTWDKIGYDAQHPLVTTTTQHSTLPGMKPEAPVTSYMRSGYSPKDPRTISYGYQEVNNASERPGLKLRQGKLPTEGTPPKPKPTPWSGQIRTTPLGNPGAALSVGPNSATKKGPLTPAQRSAAARKGAATRKRNGK